MNERFKTGQPIKVIVLIAYLEVYGECSMEFLCCVEDDLIEKGYSVTYEDGGAMIFHRNMLLALKSISGNTKATQALRGAESDYFILGADTLPLEML